MTELNASVEIIPNKLYWISDTAPPRNHRSSFYFCIDNDLVYQPFYMDFGPLNIGMTYKFCSELEKLINSPAHSSHRIYHFTSLLAHKRINAAYLMCAFQVIILKRSAEQSFEPFKSLPPFEGFRDAGGTNSPYRCSILHCLRGLEKSIQLNWFDMKTFNVKDYEFYERVENGDWNWVIPGKMLAFASPSPAQIDQQGFKLWTPEDYASLFKQIGVTAVVRLNNKTYEAERFTLLGIRHYDIYFVDGSVPSREIIDQFLKICEEEPGGIAVHCKAGLGRTGTLIGMYAMKHYRFPAEDFIGYIRLCRPGSVLGPQQQFLCDMQEQAFSWNDDFNGENDIESRVYRMEVSSPEEMKSPMSPEDKHISMFGDNGQAERLMDAKKSNQNSPNVSSPIPKTKNSPVERAGMISLESKNSKNMANIFAKSNSVRIENGRRSQYAK